jgi:Domain of unknown function (DUF4274)
MTDIEQFDDLLLAQQIEVLEKASPDDWHCVAATYNWDDDLRVLYWIVSQPECDKATALCVFWNGEPTGYDFENDTQIMGQDPYAVEPMLKYIVQRFNTTGYSRSEIIFDTVTSRGLSNLSAYASLRRDGIQEDFDELVDRQKDMANRTVKIHPDMGVFPTSGHKIVRETSTGFDASYPISVCYETGDFIYEEPSKPSPVVDAGASNTALFARNENDGASSNIRALREKMNQASPSDAKDTNSGYGRTQAKAEKAKTRSGGLGREETWFFFYAIGLGYSLIGLLAFSSGKSYSTIGWVITLIGIGWMTWNAVSSIRMFEREISVTRLAGATAIGLFSGVCLSPLGFAGAVVLKHNFGPTIGVIIAFAIVIPLQWIIAAIFDLGYLKRAS